MPYERFEAWKVCDELAVEVYRVTRSFPKHEQYGLTSQARRAAFSAPVNIAEGSAKPGAAEFCRFLNISIGSLSERSSSFWLSLITGAWRPCVDGPAS
jgi:four helix bundle protein